MCTRGCMVPGLLAVSVVSFLVVLFVFNVLLKPVPFKICNPDCQKWVNVTESSVLSVSLHSFKFNLTQVCFAVITADSFASFLVAFDVLLKPVPFYFS